MFVIHATSSAKRSLELRLELQRLGILFLTAGTFQINDHLARDRERDLRSKILLDQREREINPGGDAGRSVELPVLHEQGVRLHLQLRKTLRDISRKAPVRRDAAAIQQSRRRQSVNAGANRSDAPRRLRSSR